MTWTVKQELCVYDDRGYAVSTAETPELAARIVAMAEALEKARKALKTAERHMVQYWNAIAPGAIYAGGNNFADKDEAVLKVRAAIDATEAGS